MFLRIWDGIVDSRYFVVDIPYEAVIVEPILKILCPKLIQLNCSIPNTRENDLKRLEELFGEHKMLVKSDGFYTYTPSPPPHPPIPRVG